MASMFSEIPMQIPEYLRNQIPDYSSDAEKHIRFTNLVLDLVKKIMEEGAPPAAPKRTYLKGGKKRSASGEPVKPSEESKVDRATVLALAKIASGRNITKITKGVIEEDQPMDPKEAEVRLKGQLDMLKAIDKEEQKLRAYIAAHARKPRKLGEPVQPVSKMAFSEIEERIKKLADSAEILDNTLRSLEPFSMDGLEEGIKQEKGVEGNKMLAALHRKLQGAEGKLSDFCDEYFAAKRYAQSDPKGDELLAQVAKMNQRFGKFLLVEARMEMKEMYEKVKEQQQQGAVRAQNFLNAHEFKELPPSPDVNTQAILQGQKELKEQYKEQAQETRKEQGRGRAVALVGNFSQLLLGAGAIITSGGVKVGRLVGEVAGKFVNVPGAEAVSRQLGEAAGALTGASVTKELVQATAPAFSSIVLLTQMGTWGKEEWTVGLSTYLTTFTLTCLCSGSYTTAHTAATLCTCATSMFAKRIDQTVSYAKTKVYGFAQERGHRLGESSHMEVFVPLLEFAKAYVDANPAEGREAKRRKVENQKI